MAYFYEFIGQLPNGREWKETLKTSEYLSNYDEEDMAVDFMYKHCEEYYDAAMEQKYIQELLDDDEANSDLTEQELEEKAAELFYDDMFDKVSWYCDSDSDYSYGY